MHCFRYFLITLIFTLVAGTVLAASDSNFACGGKVETEVWNIWDSNARNYLNQRFLQDRLLKQGDVYALYDFQTYTHNMVSMARRCNRTSRLVEVANLIRMAYGALETGTPSSPGRRWVCRGGAICNDKNRLLNKEVMLDSVQFLALATSVANALALSSTSLGDKEKIFIRDTVQIATEHLLRWGDKAAISSLRKLYAAKPQDVKDNSHPLFTDKHLWLITIYAELSGIFQANDRQKLDLNELSAENKARSQNHLSMLLQLFLARISIQHDSNSRLGNVDLADLDRGYWRLYGTNRYAGYEGDLKPVVCSFLKQDKTKFTMEVVVPADSIKKREDTGWDISHARRLVHALDALERNRDEMKDIFSLNDGQLPAVGLPTAFANTLVAVVWNGDTTNPLFANYWSGANGWYRVAYDNRTGQCREGYPPYGLTDSFPTGGYITWARYKPVIGLLGQRLYTLISSPDGASSPFIVKYYKGLSKSTLSKFMFLPSLVGVTNE